jgi:hypothetical protein
VLGVPCSGLSGAVRPGAAARSAPGRLRRRAGAADVAGAGVGDTVVIVGQDVAGARVGDAVVIVGQDVAGAGAGDAVGRVCGVAVVVSVGDADADVVVGVAVGFGVGAAWCSTCW